MVSFLFQAFIYLDGIEVPEVEVWLCITLKMFDVLADTTMKAKRLKQFGLK
jgi:hypothetical protein